MDILIEALFNSLNTKLDEPDRFISKGQNIRPLVNTNVQLQSLLKKAHDENKLREQMYNELVTKFEKQKQELINQHLEELNITILRLQQSVQRANSDSDSRAALYDHEINEKNLLIEKIEKTHDELLSKISLYENEISDKDKMISKLEYELLSSNSSLAFIKNKHLVIESNFAAKDTEVFLFFIFFNI